MKSYLFLFFFLLSFLLGLPSSFSQISPFIGANSGQSDSTHEWWSLENDYVKVYYPKNWEDEAIRAAHLTEKFAKASGKNLGIAKPKKFPLILRPEVARPNGFVTLMPRRSEWFFHQSFTPFVGGLDFFDALAIHEYRHINQFDFSFRSTNMMGYYLFGEMGVALLNAFGLPSWFYEGDAVWAETFYTEGGRGRSPRFWARLKALVLSDQIPTYDELIGRSYKTVLPNHYVFGHFLVSRAYRLFGQNFWRRVLDDVMDLAINPYRIYQKFEENSGVPFEKFYNDTLKELKNRWQMNGAKLPKVEKFAEGYKETRFPLEDGSKLYYLERELNGFWTLVDQEGQAIRELPLSPTNSKVDLKKGLFLYTQFLPDARYNYKGSSDLFIYDLKKDEVFQLTEGRRIFHPQWHSSGQKLVALEKVEGARFQLVEMTIREHQIEKERRVPFGLGIPLEATYDVANRLLILFQDLQGRKGIASLDLKTFKARELVIPNRLNFFNLKATQKGLFFEGDFEERVQVYRLGENSLSICSEEGIMAQSPNWVAGQLVYAATDAMGESLRKVSKPKCRPIKSSSLAKSQGTLGMITKGEPRRELKEYQKLEKEEAGEFFGGLSPHSWSFIGGRGYQVQLTGNNYLGTIAYTASVGVDAEESTPFALLGLDFSKHLITTSLYGLFEERKSRVITSGPEISWREKEAGVRLLIPQVKVSGFDFLQWQLGINGGLIQVSERTGVPLNETNNEDLTFYGIEGSFQWQKQLTYQEIYPDYGLRARGFYRQVESSRRDSFESSLTFLETSVFLPGLSENQGLRLKGTFEDQTAGLFNYRHSPVAELANEYVFSRGFQYAYVDRYLKSSVDYVAPLWYADWNLLDFHYLRRAYLSAFYDHTQYDLVGFSGDLQSFGGELYMEVTLLRRFPLIYGLRYSNKVNSDQVWDFFLASQFTF